MECEKGDRCLYVITFLKLGIINFYINYHSSGYNLSMKYFLARILFLYYMEFLKLFLISFILKYVLVFYIYVIFKYILINLLEV